MELRQLRYFVVLAEELHFARASERLGIAQPSLSSQIQVLEASLGTKLFARTRRRVQLTSAGEIFLNEARLTIGQADRALRVGRRAGRGEIGTLRIAVTVGGSMTGVPSTIMSRFRKKHPEVDLQVGVLSPAGQIDGLFDNSLDAGFVILPAHMPDSLERIALFMEDQFVALPQDNPLAQRETLTATDLAGESFLVLNPESSAGIQEHTYELGKVGGFTPRIAKSENNLLALLSLVSAGLGVVLISNSVKRVGMPGVVYRRVVDFSHSLELDVVFRKEEHAKVTQAFLDECRFWARDHGNVGLL